MLFDYGVVAVREEPLTHSFRVFFGGEGAELDVEEFVLRLVPDNHGIASPFECSEQAVGVFLMGDGGYLDECGPRCRGRYGRDGWWGGF